MKKFTSNKILYPVLAVFCLLLAAQPVQARDFNNKLQNRPYADMRKWHLGFSVGMYTGDMRLAHNGFITDDGAQWRIDQPDYQPGFAVTGLFNLRLNNYFSVRLSPGMLFGSYDFTMKDINNPEADTQRQNLKTTYVIVPVDVKFSAQRYRNSRPYMSAGVMPAFDVAKKRSDFLKFKTTDVYLSVALGCDFYLPYFKLIPELKFCFGLTDLLVKDRPDLTDDPAKLVMTQSLSRATSKMIIFSLYFE